MTPSDELRSEALSPVIKERAKGFINPRVSGMTSRSNIVEENIAREAANSFIGKEF
ncbi:MAG: hypothetical protein GY749_46460 [Desulfobacteraceae bacterium]|nr:hypothetical protein [Desulfobacteraceae bacterium]